MVGNDKGCAQITTRKRVLHLLRWGLVPHWAKDPAIGARLSNARGETVADKPSSVTPSSAGAVSCPPMASMNGKLKAAANSRIISVCALVRGLRVRCHLGVMACACLLPTDRSFATRRFAALVGARFPNRSRAGRSTHALSARPARRNASLSDRDWRAPGRQR